MFDEDVELDEEYAGKIGQSVQGPTRIHIKVADESGYDRIRTVRFGKGIQARVGFRDGKSHVISLLFDKEKWTSQRARSWWKSHRKTLASVDGVDVEDVLEFLRTNASVSEDISRDLLSAFESIRAYIKMADSMASVYVEPELLDTPEGYGFDLPEPTPSKAYAVFRLLSFHPIVNQRRDTFDERDVADRAIQSLQGSPLFGNEDLGDHFTRSGKRGPQVGAVLSARRYEGAIYALAAIYKDVLEHHYGLNAAELPSGYSVSMEVRFDPDTARYLKDGKMFSRDDAVEAGIASPDPGADNPRNYDARFIVPTEYHAVALLRRGRNADHTADVMLAAASKEQQMSEEIQEWHEEDFDGFVIAAQSLGAELQSKERRELPKSSFAYVDDEGKGHLPINDAAHTRNALARLNQTNISIEAKKAAFRKILAAARKFGVDIDKDSTVYKTYAAMHGEEHHKMLKEKMKKKKTAMASFDVVDDSGNSVVFIDDNILYRARLKFDDDADLAIDAVEELARILKEADMAEDTDKKVVDEAAIKAEIEKTFQAREPEIAKAAVEQFKTSDEFKQLLEEARAEAITEHEKIRETIAARLKELEQIQPFKDDADRQTLEAKVAETVANDVEWYKMKSERYESALASISRKVQVAKTPTPTLVSTKAAAVKATNPFDFVEEGA